MKSPRSIPGLVAAVVGVALVSAVFVTSVSAGATGPNLIANGDFSQGTDHWTVWLPNQNSHTTLTVDNGTATVSNDDPDIYDNWPTVFGECITVQPNTQYTLSALIRIPSGQERHGDAAIIARLSDAPDCTTVSGSDEGPAPVTTVGPSFVSVTHTFTTNSGIHSLAVMFGTHKVAPTVGEDKTDPFRADFRSLALRGPRLVTPDVPQGPFDIVISGPLGEHQGPSTTPVTPPSQEPPVSSTPTPTGITAPPDVQHVAPDATAEQDPQATPLPPSTGNGRQPTTGHSMPWMLAAGLLFLAVSTVPGLKAWSRR
jgi:hypothetical protein